MVTTLPVSQINKHNALLSLPTEIPLEAGEVWWGGCASDGIQMPFDGQSPIERDLASDGRGNQASPFLISSMGRYLWSDEPFTFQFSEGTVMLSGSMRSILLSDGHGTLKRAFQAASSDHFPPSGIIPPEVFFSKPQYNTWIELTHHQHQVGILSYAQGLIDNGFPPGLMMIDAGWDDYWGKLDFHRGRFPDPAGMVRELKSMGFHVLLWVSPFIRPDSEEFRAFRGEKGMFLRQFDGQPSIIKWWDGHSAHLDLTDPSAISWLEKKLNYLQNEYGIDGFKFDAGDTLHYSHRPYSVLNATPVELTECWARFGLKFPFNEFRACWKMAGQPLIQRLSDRLPDWSDHGLSSLIPNGLAQGILGHPFICPDMIGGGEYLAFQGMAEGIDEEFFVRSAQVSALFPMMQFSASPARVLSEQAKAHCLEAVELHTRLVPALLELAKESARTGAPILRPMEWTFPSAGYAGVKDQFLLGDDILAAPVVTKAARTRKIVFPEGTWRSEDGLTIEGPCTQEIPVSLASVPVYFRQN